MKMLLKCEFIYIFASIFLILPTISSSTEVHYLQEGEFFNYKPLYRASHLHIFCYAGKPKAIIHVWQTILLQIKHSTNEYTQFDGATPELVEMEYKNNRQIWSFNLFSTKQEKLKLDPFDKSCIGIESKDGYSVHLNVIKIDLWKLLYLCSGIMLFLSAKKLSSNTLFYYVCGISFGICASVMILIYFASKIVPRKPFMYGVLGCGWTIVIYLLQLLWENTRTILLNYKGYLLWYILGTGVISFIFCYRWGPVENQRTKNLIQWTLQLAGLIGIFFSSQFQEAAMGQIVILLLLYILPSHWISAPKTYWKKRFPPKVKVLTNDEYYKQGVEETTRALKDLREYCSSPECNQWNVALKLKDVKRFASFIEGNSHLSDDEILEYETSLHGELTDDEAQFSEEESYER